MSSLSSSNCTAAVSGQKKLRISRRSPPESRWRSKRQLHIYGRCLLKALRATRGAPPSHQAVKDAADSALAVTARSQSRWSRAILSGRSHRRKLLLKPGRKILMRRPSRSRGKLEASSAEVMNGSKVSSRLRVLSRLVPGCRKLSATRLLEEASDYVAALEIQVKAMRALADALSAAAPSALPVRQKGGISNLNCVGETSPETETKVWIRVSKRSQWPEF